MSIPWLMQAFLAPLIGMLADKVGEKPKILLLSGTFLFCALLMFL
jgi:hypothetical protein